MLHNAEMPTEVSESDVTIFKQIFFVFFSVLSNVQIMVLCAQMESASTQILFVIKSRTVRIFPMKTQVIF